MCGFLRDNNVRFDLKWIIKKKAQVYSAGAKYCDLCLTEKTIIMLASQEFKNSFRFGCRLLPIKTGK